MANVIDVSALDKRYNGDPILRGLDLAVPEGSVFAFLGRNGAGKTTTIKILLGLLDADNGSVQVLDRDPVSQAKALMQEIGYVSEDRPLYDWMTASEMIRFTSAFYGTWDAALAASIADRLRIRPDRKIRKMSRGEKGKLSLLLALAHKPRLLILDEPTAGLDSVVRRQFIEETIEIIAEEGRTVFFSTHLIDEVERVADRVGILTGGKLAVHGTVQDLKDNFRRVKAFFGKDTTAVEPPEGAFSFRRFDRHVLFLTMSFDPTVREELEKQGADKVEVEDMSLDDIFVELTREED